MRRFWMEGLVAAPLAASAAVCAVAFADAQLPGAARVKGVMVQRPPERTSA